MSCTWPCARPVPSRVHVPCTGRVRSVYTAEDVRAKRPVHSHVHGWCRRAMCTSHTRPCTGRVYGTAVIRPCTGRFRGPCTRPPCNGHTTRYTGPCVYTARTRPHNGRLDGRTARTRPCNCRVDFPCTPCTCCSRTVYTAVDGQCRRPVYTAAYMALTFTRPVHGDNAASR